jgi:hypothetical protein
MRKAVLRRTAFFCFGYSVFYVKENGSSGILEGCEC